ncbi:hypothetical protein RXV95_12930 [Novosphingobium sp. ZN18A2]|uniref:hypothetical protein n=1 Tax=Novosphingobium sp. ZN18A2 TaxID=3079861 RepID=UPI0030D42EA5
MIVTANRLRNIGWLALLGLFAALILVQAFHVNALRSEVRHSENRIVALKQEKMYLETEFETRSNQQQLKAWNDLDFGYVAPKAQQYIEGERQLAALGKPAGPDAPAPIRVASADDAVAARAAFPAVVSSLADRMEDVADGVKSADDAKPAKAVDRKKAAEGLGKRLTLLDADDSALPVGPHHRIVVDKSADILADKGGKAKSSATAGTLKGAVEATRR